MAQEETNAMGFMNSAVLGDVYVIGATHNIHLDRFALWLVGITLAGIAIHTGIRTLAGLFRRGRKSGANACLSYPCGFVSGTGPMHF